MEQPIVIRFRWTADELLQASRYHFRHSCRPVFRFALHVIFALMILGGYGLIRNGGDSLPFGVVLILGGVYWFTLRPVERRWLVRRQFLNRPERDMDLEWQVGPDKIRTQNALGQSEFAWATFTKMVRTPSGILFYPTEQIFHWLPRSGFATDAEFDKCVEIASTKIEKHYDVT